MCFVVITARGGNFDEFKNMTNFPANKGTQTVIKNSNKLK